MYLLLFLLLLLLLLFLKPYTSAHFLPFPKVSDIARLLFIPIYLNPLQLRPFVLCLVLSSPLLVPSIVAVVVCFSIPWFCILENALQTTAY